MNTIDELGDLTTFRNIIKGEITEFVDDSIIELPDYAFYGCISLTSVSFPNATSIGSQAFYMCKEITGAFFPNATTIGRYAFRDCRFVEVSFPNVTSIIEYSFNYCEELLTVSFPKVTTVGNSAFYGCSKLTTMYIGTETDTVCTLENANAIPSRVTDIYVPSALVEQYKTATNWSNFADKIKAYTGEIA